MSTFFFFIHNYKGNKKYRYFVAGNCALGYAGMYCQNKCDYPRYGDGCQKFCSCSKQKCDVSTGCGLDLNSKCFFQQTCFFLLFMLNRYILLSFSVLIVVVFVFTKTSIIYSRVNTPSYT